jgi:hypothetical protein
MLPICKGIVQDVPAKQEIASTEEHHLAMTDGLIGRNATVSKNRAFCIIQERLEHPCFPVNQPPQSKFRKSRWQGLFNRYLIITKNRAFRCFYNNYGSNSKLQYEFIPA